MPPMAFRGLVTKVGCMDKTATVTVTRMVLHKTTQKRIERTKKYLAHDPENSAIPSLLVDQSSRLTFAH
ncbi:hypothetical protein D9757_005385 [Collybiopsis confluens]|uniref:Ribosomal protein S17 n=1 Tax=Collybiopsis confluens TaxID=2823264 RepID=A0A8H5HL75_9AGAR|nr:hypothetical protein D9757_005385 [Collybiopsis confluens]